MKRRKKIKKFFFLSLALLSNSFSLINASVTDPVLPAEGVVSPDHNSFIDPNVHYAVFPGRITDRDKSKRILKVKAENNNIKFFRAGDLVMFSVNQDSRPRKECQGYIRTVEDFYFTFYVKDFSPCWDSEEYLKRGTAINFNSPLLAQRIFEASKYREILLARKDDFLRQLNGINHFLWSYEQEKVKTAADFDLRIDKIQKEKRVALDDLVAKKQEGLTLQTELMRKLNELDESLKFYRIERQELLTDRWQSDHDLGHPLPHRPQEIKPDELPPVKKAKLHPKYDNPY